MGYTLIVIGLLLALAGLFKKHFPMLESRRITVALALLILATSGIDMYREYDVGSKTAQRAWHGRLHSPIKSTERYPILMLGPSPIQYSGDPNRPLFQVADEAIFLRMVNGEAALSLGLRDHMGKVLGGIRDNEWFLYPGPISDRNFNEIL